MGSTVARSTAGWCATPPRVWAPWPTEAPGPIGVPIRPPQRSRPGSWPCGGPIPAGGPGPSVSFAGTTYRAGNRYIGHVVGVRVVGDTVQIALDRLLMRTHRARHDKLKEFG